VAGIWTVGYGHTGGVTEGQNITLEQADALLEQDLEHVETAILCLVTAPLSDNQFSALCSLVFNIGAGHFKDSTLLKRLNEGKYADAANWFLPWNRAGGKEVEALADRRRAERALFLRPDNV
jgi:lysozyme